MPAYTLSAGRLRHRVTIQQKVEVQDTFGEMNVEWQNFASNVPAEIAPLSAREFIAAKAVQATVSTKITIRYRTGILANMRVVHVAKGGETTIYNIAKPIRDNKTGLGWLTLLATDGVNDG